MHRILCVVALWWCACIAMSALAADQKQTKVVKINNAITWCRPQATSTWSKRRTGRAYRYGDI